MTRTSLLLSFMLMLLFSSTKLTAADTGYIYCRAGESYVYLYQSAENFQVLANIGRGQKIEILEAQNDAMVRVRTGDGKEGYVSKSELTAMVSGTQQQGAISSPGTSASTPPPATPQPSPAQVTRGPLTDSELMALAAGNALSENIVQEIASRGLVFRPDDHYRSLIQTAGADAAVLAALGKAKITSSGQGASN